MEQPRPNPTQIRQEMGHPVCPFNTRTHVHFTLRSARREPDLLRPADQPEGVEDPRDVGGRVPQQRLEAIV